MRRPSWAATLLGIALVCALFVSEDAWSQSGGGPIAGAPGGPGGGPAVGLDLDDDDVLESAGLTRMTVTGDNSSGFISRVSNEVRFNLDLPVNFAISADIATELAQNPGNCVTQFLRGLAADGTPNCASILQSDLPADLAAVYANEINTDQGANPELSFSGGTAWFDPGKTGTAVATLDSIGNLVLGGDLTLGPKADGERAVRVQCNTTDLPEPASGSISIGCAADTPSYRLNGGSTSSLLGGSFTPNADPESDHSGFDAAVYSDVDLTSVTSSANYTPADNGHTGASLAEHLDGIDDRIGELQVWVADYSILNPADADDHVWLRAPYAITITDIDCIIDPADTGESISITFRECNSTGDSCTAIEAAITADNDGASDDGIDNSVIDAGDWVDVLIGAPSGTVHSLACTLVGTH